MLFHSLVIPKGEKMTGWPKIVVPGVVWGSLLVGLTYLLVANFEGQEWLPIVLVLINAILKYIEVKIGQPIPTVTPSEYRGEEGHVVRTPKLGILHRWLIA